MRRLSVIWQILFSDKWAVFTFNDVPEDPEKLTAPYFKWNISHKDPYFFQLIRNRLKNIENNEVRTEKAG